MEEKFKLFSDLLIEWNKKINLTAITDKKEIEIKHFKDSLTIAKFINQDSKVIDIGTGAGFPGIPLKINDNSLDITLVDSLNKRVNFLNEVINKLNLQKIETIHSRAEDLGQNKKFREKYDVAVSRAVANMSTLAEYLLPFVKIGGIVIFMKGINIDEELKMAKNAILELGGKVEFIENIKINNDKEIFDRNIIIVRKIKHTKSKYPRKAGLPQKNPIL